MPDTFITMPEDEKAKTTGVSAEMPDPGEKMTVEADSALPPANWVSDELETVLPKDFRATYEDTDQQHWRDTIGIFYDDDALEDAIAGLESAGFAKGDISVLADESTLRRKLGRKFRNVRELAYDPTTPRRPATLKQDLSLAQGMSIILGVTVGLGAAIGTAIAAMGEMTDIQMLVTMIAGSISGACIGTSQALMMNRRRNKSIREQIRRGGLLLWVKVKGDKQETRAKSILSSNKAREVNVHEFAAANAPS